jgi:hypothetical protein
MNDVAKKIPAPRTARQNGIISYEKYKALLTRHNLRQIDVAWLAGVGWRQARRWSDGDAAPPASWVLLLLAYDAGLLSAEWLAEHAAKGRALDDIKY